MSNRKPPQQFTVVLQDTGGDAPVYRRLARVLKSLGRNYGFACKAVFPGNRLDLRRPAGDGDQTDGRAA